MVLVAGMTSSIVALVLAGMAVMTPVGAQCSAQTMTTGSGCPLTIIGGMVAIRGGTAIAAGQGQIEDTAYKESTTKVTCRLSSVGAWWRRRQIL